jgi:hypothetical protein
MIRAPILAVLATLFLAFLGSCQKALSVGADQPRIVRGLKVYFGAVPAEIVRERSQLYPSEMHGGIPTGVHEYHFVTAIFDATSGARVTDAAVTAQVSAPGLPAMTKKLELMELYGAPRYGGFFSLETRDLYTVKLTIERLGGAPPVTVEFKYDHRVVKE